jgi:hypothetical protein
MRTERTQNFWLARAFALASLCAVLGGGATAAMLDQFFPEGIPGYGTSAGVTVRSRLHPEQEPLGIRLGSFLVHPQIQTGLGYDSNVLGGRASNGSWLARNQPSILFSSDWSRNAVGGYFSADDKRYLDQPAQSRTDGTMAVAGSVDVGRDRVSAAVAHVAQHEDRNRLDALPSDRPIAFTFDDARLSYAAGFGRWTVTPSAEVSRWRYDGTTVMGLPASQAYRDRDVIEGATTLQYELAPLRSLLLVGRITGQSYPNSLPGEPSQHSTGFQLLAGFDYDDDAVWRYRMMVGGEVRQFASFPTRTALIAEADVTWMPSGLTTVHGQLGRTIEDAAQPGVSGYTFTNAKLTIDHEYMRNLVFSASLGVQEAAYLQGGSQAGFSAGIGATWLVDRMVSVSATYNVTSYGGGHPNGTIASEPSTRNLALLMVHLGL